MCLPSSVLPCLSLHNCAGVFVCVCVCESVCVCLPPWMRRSNAFDMEHNRVDSLVSQ